MKNTLITLFFCFLSFAVFAQQDVTKFLGIPVDGSKTQMIKKLEAKGYKYNPSTDMLSGEFNGRDVKISVVTNNNKVYRIVVYDAYYTESETSIRIKFNRLVEQFNSNKRYVSASFEDQKISDKEDVAYEISVKDKRYEAVFYQLPENMDSTMWEKSMQAYIFSEYTQEQLENMDEDGKKEVMVKTLFWAFEKISKKTVWFLIDNRYGEYGIIMYYDNEYNRANGEDL